MIWWLISLARGFACFGLAAWIDPGIGLRFWVCFLSGQALVLAGYAEIFVRGILTSAGRRHGR